MKKGFIITGIIYSMFLLFVVVLFGNLSSEIISSRINRGKTIAVNRLTCEKSFAYTGSLQICLVPLDVSSLIMEVWGAQGGGATGGLGGYTKATIPVTPGEVLHVYAGGQGGTGTCAGDVCRVGGFNGGGLSGYSNSYGSNYGGGGATDIRRSPYGLNDRLIVAGGGGSMGGTFSNLIAPGIGGSGGQNGAPGGTCDGCVEAGVMGGPGGGATQSSGGSAGNGGLYDLSDRYPGMPGYPGLFGQGADGAVCWWAASGSGGGGYYGGGSGGCPGQQGGGGGSSWVIPSATSVNYTSGLNSGHGKATMTRSS